MALPAILSAVRQLILDGDAIPDSTDARRAQYAARFADLSATELDDLAQIAPDRIGAQPHRAVRTRPHGACPHGIRLAIVDWRAARTDASQMPPRAPAVHPLGVA